MDTLIQKKSFYGKTKSPSSWMVRLKRKEKEYKKHVIPTEYKASIDGPPSDWKCFYRQDEAFEYIRKRGQTLHVFSYESTTFGENQGKRLFLVVSYVQFWHYYSQLPMEKRHHYEVIQNGSVCRLYFDLEFSVSMNPASNGPAMTYSFIKYICGWLKKEFNLTCTIRDVLQLDASTQQKFSRHLLFHLPSAVFQDNIQAGNFVNYALSYVWHLSSQHQNNDPSSNSVKEKSTTNEEIEYHKDMKEELIKWNLTENDVKKFIVKNKHENDVLFCDTGVYTKNRNFRLYHSCKLGKNNPLVLAPDNVFPLRKDKQDYHIFMDSLITNVEYSSKLKILTYGNKAPSKSGPGVQNHGSREENECLSGYQYSPYPEVDDFIRTQITTGGVQGYIRRWSYFPQSELLLFEIGRNRWCQNINRPHRSNNIMMVADLKSAVYYQKCHDPECKAIGFKSPEIPLPSDVLPSHHLAEDFTMEEDELSDTDLMEAADMAEQSLDYTEDDAQLLQAAERLETDLNALENHN